MGKEQVIYLKCTYAHLEGKQNRTLPFLRIASGNLFGHTGKQ